MDLPDSDQVPRDWSYSGTNLETSAFAYGTVTLYGSAFQRILLALSFVTHDGRPHNPAGRSRRFGLFPVRSPLLRKSSFLSFPPGTEMFQFPGLASYTYGFSM